MDSSEIYPRRLNGQEVLITKEDGEFVFPVAQSGTAKNRERLRIPRTHSETGIHREERISAENLMATGKSCNLKKQMMTQKLGETLGLFKEVSFIVIKTNREFNHTCREKNHSLCHKIYIIERNSSEKKYSIRGEDWKSQNI